MPVDVGRDEARGAAARELSDPIYRRHEPSWFERAMDWTFDRIDELFDAVAGAAPGGVAGLILLLVMVAAIVVVVRLRLGPVARTPRSPGSVLGASMASAAEHRAASQAAAERAEYAEAVAERFRAVVRELEQRGVLEYAAGLTADEITKAAASALPGSAQGLRAAARIFDDVYYGGLRATAAQYEYLCTVDDQVRSERPAKAGAG